jgi:hypothetical protein
MTLTDLKPLIPNQRNFSRRHIVSAVMRLGYTKEKDYAERIASQLIADAKQAGIISQLFLTDGRGRAYEFTAATVSTGIR